MPLDPSPSPDFSTLSSALSYMCPSLARPRGALTLRGTVSEEGHQQWYVVDVLQVGPHLVDAPGQLGLEETELSVVSGQGAENHPSSCPSLPESVLWPLQGVGYIPPYPVAVLQEAGDVTVRGLEADEI